MPATRTAASEPAASPLIGRLRAAGIVAPRTAVREAERAAIERDAWLLSLASGTLVLLLLLRIYRRPGVVALCFTRASTSSGVG